jgi:hypothetical protein
MDSTGPDVKIRGTPAHIYEKYLQLARDAHSGGDRVQAENYLQHAEHYYRLIMAAQAQMPQPQQRPSNGHGQNGAEGHPQPDGGSDPQPVLADQPAEAPGAID